MIGTIPAARFSEKPAELKKDNPVDVVIQIAESQVGYHEGANNHTKYGDELHALQPKNMERIFVTLDVSKPVTSRLVRLLQSENM